MKDKTNKLLEEKYSEIKGRKRYDSNVNMEKFLTWREIKSIPLNFKDEIERAISVKSVRTQKYSDGVIFYYNSADRQMAKIINNYGADPANLAQL